jgi:hypothetical protein
VKPGQRAEASSKVVEVLQPHAQGQEDAWPSPLGGGMRVGAAAGVGGSGPDMAII